MAPGAARALGWGNGMRPAPLLVALSLIVTAPDAARAQDVSRETGREQRFVDFRARPGALWGHTFILYGRVDQRGALKVLNGG
jgi:hypothetical protein